MRDLTTGSILHHLFSLTVPIAMSILVTTVFLVVDLYFVAQLGEAPLAGVTATANVSFIAMGLANALSVGASVAISHAAGRKDREEANRIFNQAIMLALTIAALLVVLCFTFSGIYVQVVVSDNEISAHAALTYLYWLIPSFGLQMLLAAFRAGLRGTGTIMPLMVAQFASIALNIVLAPVLILGWGTGWPLGAAGAGLATSISFVLSVWLLWVYLRRPGSFLIVHAGLCRPLLSHWKRILAFGVPTSVESLVTFLYVAFLYWVIRDFGEAAQAGFGIASRLIHAISFPAMALAYAIVPIAGQSFGAGKLDRIRETFSTATASITAILVVLTLLCLIFPDELLSVFTTDQNALSYGRSHLVVLCWGFVLQGLVSAGASVLQATGSTQQMLLGTVVRIVIFVPCALWAMSRDSVTLEHVWYASLFALFVQAVFVSALVFRKLRNRHLRADETQKLGSHAVR